MVMWASRLVEALARALSGRYQPVLTVLLLFIGN